MAAEQIITNALKDVVQEIRVQSLTKHVRNFHGEGASKFSSWLKDMQQLSSTCDSERMCVLATLTLGGSAGTFVARTLKENPRISWEELKKLLKTRYSELTDPFMAKKKCRRMQQRSGKSVKNFAESSSPTPVRYAHSPTKHSCTGCIRRRQATPRTRNHSGHSSERRKRHIFKMLYLLNKYDIK